MEEMINNKYFKGFYEVWYESVKIMKNQHEHNKFVNEGIIFIQD